MESYHSPVLLNESIKALDIQIDGVYVDCTFGGGGHSQQILNRLDSEGKLLSFDCDEDAVNNKLDDKRFTLVPANFRFIKRFLKLNRIKKVNGILADLGVSSHQFDTEIRGFSFRFNSQLDMRMNQQADLNAKKVLNEYSAEDLANVLFQYGDVRASRKLARAIINARPINTTFDFKEVIKTISKDDKLLTQAFQAIRIEVNDEMGALKELLQQSVEVLEQGGRLVVISYHSVEDRLVKNYFKTATFNGVPEKDLYGRFETYFKQNEIYVNKRARSAKLRIGERI
ncbi:UNVERIFIED_CONTAM: hypothetical protein GTU68_016775 [Idotea baltica]|nr:hypothetical protein [Idotea baltica]